jgi:hypothetical protein
MPAKSVEYLYDDAQAFYLQGHRQVDQGEVVTPTYDLYHSRSMDDYIFETNCHDIT